jgi:hypothetical protein
MILWVFNAGDCAAVCACAGQGGRAAGQGHCIQPPVASAAAAGAMGPPAEGWGFAAVLDSNQSTCLPRLHPDAHSISDSHRLALAIVLLSSQPSLACCFCLGFLASVLDQPVVPSAADVGNEWLAPREVVFADAMAAR